MNQPDLSIVIPAYSEERRIGSTLDELAMYLKSNSFFKSKTVEVLVVAADTTDSTPEIVFSKKTLFKDLSLLSPGPAIGKGRDVQYGVLRANGKVIVFMDADLATPLHHLESFYKSCIDSNDLVIGTRNLLSYRSSRLRNLFSYIGNLIYILISGMNIEDTQCGFKMFNQHSAKLCFSKLTILGWGFDVEILAIAKANKLSIKPIRINDWVDKPYSTHTEGVLRISVRNVREFWEIEWNRVIGKYKDEKR